MSLRFKGDAGPAKKDKKEKKKKKRARDDDEDDGAVPREKGSGRIVCTNKTVQGISNWIAAIEDEFISIDNSCHIRGGLSDVIMVHKLHQPRSLRIAKNQGLSTFWGCLLLLAMVDINTRIQANQLHVLVVLRQDCLKKVMGLSRSETC